MKNILPIGAIIIFSFLLLNGCATAVPVGGVYTEVKLPIAATDNVSSSPKVGIAECKSYFGLVAIGDCSIETAKKNGLITKIYHVDWDAKNILGIIGTYKLTVYGE